VEYLWGHAAVDVDGLYKVISSCTEVHAENERAQSFSARLQLDLNILSLSHLIGPEIRKKYFLELVIPGLIDRDLLLCGPSGCGKSSIAEIISANGRRRSRKLETYKLDQEDQLAKLMVDIASDGGLCNQTVFLDEAACLIGMEEEQTRLRNIPASRDLQFILASSQEYQQLTEDLSKDFAGRYCEQPFTIPALKDRRKDFIEFCTEFLKAASLIGIDSQVLDLLIDGYHWPRNYRQLKGFLDGVCRKLPPNTLTITMNVLFDNPDIFPENVRTILTTITPTKVEATASAHELRSRARSPKRSRR
jgi:hypothetical protein